MATLLLLSPIELGFTELEIFVFIRKNHKRNHFRFFRKKKEKNEKAVIFGLPDAFHAGCCTFATKGLLSFLITFCRTFALRHSVSFRIVDFFFLTFSKSKLIYINIATHQLGTLAWSYLATATGQIKKSHCHSNHNYDSTSLIFFSIAPQPKHNTILPNATV